jgi:hypothetical protein
MCTQLKPIANRITIQPAQNGFLVFINDDFNQGTVRPVPHVFETMENLLKFIQLKFEESERV